MDKISYKDMLLKPNLNPKPKIEVEVKVEVKKLDPKSRPKPAPYIKPKRRPIVKPKYIPESIYDKDGEIFWYYRTITDEERKKYHYELEPMFCDCCCSTEIAKIINREFYPCGRCWCCVGESDMY